MPSPHTPGSRDRALARLRRLTIGSIVGSAVALGAFATAAAVTYSGKTAPSTAAASNPSAGSTTPTTGPASTATPAPVQSTPEPASTPVPAPTPSFRRPRAVTGGS